MVRSQNPGVGDNFVVLPIKMLKVDRSYQRRYDHALVIRELAKNDGQFDIVWAGPVLVNQRVSGGHYVVDGQHRVGMAREAGESEILAELLEGRTREQEAEIRVARHSRKGDNPLERFHARLTAGDRNALQLKRIVEAHGGEIAVDFSAPASHLRAVKALEKVYDDSSVRLSQVLTVITDSFGSLTSKTGSSYVLHSLNWLYEHHEHQLDEKILVRRLQAHSLREIDSNARIMSAGGGSMWKNYYRAVVVLYNKNTPKQAQLIPRHS